MSKFAAGNLFLLGSIVSVTISHIMIKALIGELPSPLNVAALRAWIDVPLLVRGVVAGFFLVAGFVNWLLCLARLDLAYAYPVASSSVLLVSVFSVVVLGEPVTLRMFLGTVCIVVGVGLLGTG